MYTCHLNRLFPGVKVSNTFIHIEHADPDAFVARRSVSCPPKLFGVISSSKEAFSPEANQGGVASAEHVGLVSPSGLSTERKLQAHQLGQCRPCGFQSAKAGNCRRGDDCQFCHLCTHEEQMRKKISRNHDRRRCLRAAKSVLKASVESAVGLMD
ncbi:unnamed protein product [Polarella glacialis]|uniref:C3H1-type domain-containing protein n=1 Tax=Polarella glacialis TaxID=89957 RepID=A0A813FN99_POLGL|nr:unnamed protein product [Polarella glacialis]